MKKILIIFLLFFVALPSGCTLPNTIKNSVNATYQITEYDPNTNHYQDSEVSFYYPNYWNISVNNYSISLFNHRKQITIEKSALNNEKLSKNVPLPREVVSTKSINVDELKSQEVIYKNKGDLKPSRIEISINKNGKLFKIYLYAPPDEFDSAQVDFDSIINSIKINN